MGRRQASYGRSVGSCGSGIFKWPKPGEGVPAIREWPHSPEGHTVLSKFHILRNNSINYVITYLPKKAKRKAQAILGLRGAFAHSDFRTGDRPSRHTALRTNERERSVRSDFSAVPNPPDRRAPATDAGPTQADTNHESSGQTERRPTGARKRPAVVRPAFAASETAEGPDAGRRESAAARGPYESIKGNVRPSGDCIAPERVANGMCGTGTVTWPGDLYFRTLHR